MSCIKDPSDLLNFSISKNHEWKILVKSSLVTLTNVCTRDRAGFELRPGFLPVPRVQAQAFFILDYRIRPGS